MEFPTMNTIISIKEAYSIRKCEGVASSRKTEASTFSLVGRNKKPGNEADMMQKKAPINKKSRVDSLCCRKLSNIATYNPLPNPTYPFAIPTAVPLLEPPWQATVIILKTAPVTKALLRKVRIPRMLRAGTMKLCGMTKYSRATPQYRSRLMQPRMPPPTNAFRVPNRSEHHPGMKEKSPAKKNAVEMVSTCPCVKCNVFWRVAPYSPNE
mmetsp:Transcript_15285/g.31537  ORF Transcript_15285/g.31537 Transcript_15285/m.31537 type:complete len:210 (-) Transcript_15285:348-977(-)